MEKKNKIVLSGLNIRNAGTLSIFYNFLDELLKNISLNDHEIHIFVSNYDLFKKYNNHVIIHSFPKEKKSRFLRFYYEYIELPRFSKKNNISIWISLNDKTPKVVCDNQYLYCHNPSIFYKCTLKEILLSPSFFLQTIFYNFIYKHNLRRNKYIIVQQQWIAQEFKKRYDAENILVMRPKITNNFKKAQKEMITSPYTFIYPTAPRVFKNIEVLLEASKLLKQKTEEKFIIYITIDGNENIYSKYLRKKYKKEMNVKFTGFLDKESLENLYKKSNCLVFPSKLETWGLPLTEFANYNKQILVSDLRYAHENLKKYNKVGYFNPNDPKSLSNKMLRLINREKINETITFQSKESKFKEVESWLNVFKEK